MGVLGSNNFYTSTILSTEELYNEILYSLIVREVLNNPDISRSTVLLPDVQIEHSELNDKYEVTYREKLKKDEERLTFVDLTKLKCDTSDESEKPSKSKKSTDGEGAEIRSIETINNLTRRLYQKKLISYNSSCKLLRQMSEVTALDYYLGVGTRNIQDFDLVHSYDLSQHSYTLLGVRNNISMFRPTTRFTVLVGGNGQTSYMSLLDKFANRSDYNPFTDYFQTTYEKLLDYLTDEKFARLVKEAAKMYYSIFKDIDTDKYYTNFSNQRLLRKQGPKKLDIYRY